MLRELCIVPCLRWNPFLRGRPRILPSSFILGESSAAGVLKKSITPLHLQSLAMVHFLNA